MSTLKPYLSLGKFSSAIDETLYDMSCQGWANEHDGDSEAPTGHFSLIIISGPELAECLAAFPEMVDAGHLAGPELVGNWILTVDERGAVYVKGFPSEMLARQAYATLQLAYGEWLGDDEDE